VFDSFLEEAIMATDVGTKMICLAGAGRTRTFQASEGERKRQRLHPDIPTSPCAGDTVSCPFTAYGTLDPGADTATVTVVLDSAPYTTYSGTAVDPPPPGANWAYKFDNIPPQTYQLVDHETGPTGYDVTYVVDPVFVSQ
jgi:hypothetical protein